MNQNNHLFISHDTSISGLSDTLERHGNSISYLKIWSACVPYVDVETICSMVRGSTISVCVGGGVAKKIPKRGFLRLRKLKELSKKWINAIELPVDVLSDNDIVRTAYDYYPTRLVEVGQKTCCMDPDNSPSQFMEWIQRAEAFNPDHIVLEGSLEGDCGIYHDDRIPNILLVDDLMERFEQKTRCIIEWPLKAQQDLWRSIYGNETHIGNIEDLTTINTSNGFNYPREHWNPLREFKKRVRILTETTGLSWDDVARSHGLHTTILSHLPKLIAFDDETLLQYIQNVLARGSVYMSLFTALQGVLSEAVAWHQHHTMPLGIAIRVIRNDRAPDKG